MRKFCLLALMSIAPLAAGTSWAEQREARLLMRGPMTEMPVIRAAACDMWNKCLNDGYTACSQQPPADRANCHGAVYGNCVQKMPGCG
jgi:hypothetical protein